MRELAEDVRLDEDGAHLVGAREALDHAVGDGAHERRLARVVLAEQAVAEAALELHLRVVQQDLGAVRKCELAVAQLFRVVLVLLLGRDLDHLLALGARRVDGRARGGIVDDVRREQRQAHLGPHLGDERARVDAHAHQLGDEVERARGARVDVAELEARLERAEHLGVLDLDGDARRLELGALGLEPLELVERARAHVARLGVDDGLGRLVSAA